MNRINALIGGFMVVVLMAASGFWLWNWALGDTDEASGPIQAVPLQVEATQSPATAEGDNQASTTQPAAAAEVTNQDETTASAESLNVFEIDPSGSEVRFTIFEELFGQPKNVIGVSDQVAGQIAVDLSDLSAAQVGEIRVNARTLVTDNDRRNQAIRNRILNTDSYEFITFTPTEITGLSGEVQIGGTFNFQISGDLIIRDATHPAVFNVTAQAVSENQIRGTATAIIQRGDYNLEIPSVPNVANVGEDVTLEIDFVAGAARTASS